jgi:SPFH domain / Band 7 family
MALEDELAKLTKRAARKGGQRRGLGVVGGVLMIGGGLVALICLIIVASGFARTGPNEVGVVYNGGPLDQKTQRQLIAPSSGLTWTGWLSQDPRLYPSVGSPRRYLITSEGSGDRPGVDAVRVPTADGIDVGLEAKISFTTAFTGTPDDELMKSFDARFGNRTFASFDGRRLHPWEGDDGFAAFLDTEFRPVLDNALRETIATFRCEDLVSSCALIGRSRNVALADSEAGSQTNANLVKVQEAVATTLQRDLERNLGAPYFDNFQVIVSAVRLPERVQQAVNEAQAQFAEVNKSKADLQKARIAKQVNDTLGRSYRNCAACAQIDALKAIPSNVTAISLGGNGSVALSGK